MKVMLNASALSGAIIFSVSNIMGVNLGTGKARLAGVAGFSGSNFMGYPLFLTVIYCCHMGKEKGIILFENV